MRNDYNSNYLMHHGILGMKWGVRNGPPYPLESVAKSAAEKAGRVAGAAKEGYTKKKNSLKSNSGSRKSKALKEAREKDIDKMTTQELRDTNARLREEKAYQELTKGQIAEGKRFVDNIAKQTATAIITGIAIESGKAAVKKIMSDPYYWTTLVRILSKV